MKRIVFISTIFFGLITSSLQAIDNTPFFSKHKLSDSKNIDNIETNKASLFYTGISGTVFNTSDVKILGVQPANEIVGEGGTELAIRVGYNGYRKSDNTDLARVYLYAWSNPTRNNEVGFGGGGEYITSPFESIKGLQFLIGGQVGYGWQGVKGDTKRISTSANKLTFISDTINMNPTDMTYTEDNYVLRVDLTLGTTYKLSNALSLDFAYVYQYSNYQVEYRTAEKSSVLNILDFAQDNHGLKVGLNYKF